MTRDLQANNRPPSDARRGATNSAPGVDSRSPSVTDRIMEEAASGRCDLALGVANVHGVQDPLVANAKGVCLLRLGRTSEAVSLYRSLLFAPGCSSMRHDRPAYIKLNYATALLVAGRPDACLDVLQEMDDDQSTTAERLREAIRRWEVTLSFGQKLDWWINHVAPSGRTVPIDFTPGDFGPAAASASPTPSPILPPQQLPDLQGGCCLGD
jgi:hypothetical protein